MPLWLLQDNRGRHKNAWLLCSIQQYFVIEKKRRKRQQERFMPFLCLSATDGRQVSNNFRNENEKRRRQEVKIANKPAFEVDGCQETCDDKNFIFVTLNLLFSSNLLGKKMYCRVNESALICAICVFSPKILRKKAEKRYSSKVMVIVTNFASISNRINPKIARIFGANRLPIELNSHLIDITPSPD